MNTEQMKTEQFLLTVSAGKRLIAKAVAALPQMQAALAEHTILLLGGSTNGYVAEELLTAVGQAEGFSKNSFYRGVTTAPGRKLERSGELDGDVVLEKGRLIRGKTVFDVAPTLGRGDIILKGANAVEADRSAAGILIGNPNAGTCIPILQACVGRHVELIIPVGLEKRILGSVVKTAAKLNGPTSSGLRMMPMCGTIVTELEAIASLTGAQAELIAAGGVCGAEGAVWVAVTGTDEQLDAAARLLRPIVGEPAFGE